VVGQAYKLVFPTPSPERRRRDSSAIGSPGQPKSARCRSVQRPSGLSRYALRRAVEAYVKQQSCVAETRRIGLRHLKLKAITEIARAEFPFDDERRCLGAGRAEENVGDSRRKVSVIGVRVHGAEID
jgi:hypothetical protein